MILNLLFNWVGTNITAIRKNWWKSAISIYCHEVGNKTYRKKFHWKSLGLVSLVLLCRIVGRFIDATAKRVRFNNNHSGFRKQIQLNGRIEVLGLQSPRQWIQCTNNTYRCAKLTEIELNKCARTQSHARTSRSTLTRTQHALCKRPWYHHIGLLSHNVKN